MKGNNELRMCKAEMMAALQYYFDRVMFKKGQSPRITGIREDKSTSCPDFVVATGQPEEGGKNG